MPEVQADPLASSPVASSTPGVDLAQLDDKRLWRYRHPNERRALWAIVAGLVVVLAGLWVAQRIFGNILSFIPIPIFRTIDEWLHPERLWPVLVGIVAVMWVMDVIGQSTRAWQLVAQAVEVTPTTFPQLAPIVDELRKRFDLPRTRVYVSRDAPLSGYTIGVREPFTIVFSSMGVGSLTPDEFKFLLGREMGSIKLGHTQMATLFGNVRMSLPQPFSFLLKFRTALFGSYHHGQELSCDRIGVIATRDVRPALSTLIKQNLGQVRGARIDLKSLAPQTDELRRGMSGKAFQKMMVFNAQPFAVTRLYELVKWAGEPAPAAPSAPAAPPPPTPAQSAAAAANSAAAAAASAAEAAASAAAAVAATTGQPATDGVTSPPSSIATEAQSSAMAPAGTSECPPATVPAGGSGGALAGLAVSVQTDTPSNAPATTPADPPATEPQPGQVSSAPTGPGSTEAGRSRAS